MAALTRFIAATSSTSTASQEIILHQIDPSLTTVLAQIKKLIGIVTQETARNLQLPGRPLLTLPRHSRGIHRIILIEAI